MAISFEVTNRPADDVDVDVVAVASDALADAPVDPAVLARLRFEGKPGQLQWLPADHGDGLDRLLVGVGPAAAVDATVLRRSAAVAARAVTRRPSVRTDLAAAVADLAARPAAAQAVAEGFVLGAYRDARFRSKPEPVELSRVVLVGPGGAKVRDAVERGRAIGEAVTFARDLVNEPGGSLTPVKLAEIAVEVADREGLRVSVLDEADLAELGCGGILGVNRGSNQPPRLVELHWEPDDAKARLALVGKGITFDSGGLSLKSATGMMAMKSDMGGAAAVLAAFSALRAVHPKIAVSGYLPLTDNMTGGDATRPGDVLALRNGTTVEVLNTDAEGRLILGDALALASERSPDAIVDLATLTGAVEVALGSRIAGLLGNDDSLVERVRGAAARAGERVWPLPLPDDYRSMLDSDVADLKNIGAPGKAGTLVAGLFLREFVGAGIPWVHLDIAGTAWSDAVDGDSVKGGTGFGVRLLLELIGSWTSRARATA
ncbi:MAG: leucyl aminopeptidase [Acidimicrobiales bacterium]